jgi:ADP-ribose pyrophosphatase YjhB (NUDIX family)
MPVREGDARFVAATDYLLVNPERTRIGLILREEERVYAMMGEKFQKNETALDAMRRGWREEAGIAHIDDPRSGILHYQLAGIFGLFDHPTRDPRFLFHPDTNERYQAISCTWLCTVTFDLLSFSPGSSVIGFETFPLNQLPRLFLDHEQIIQAILKAERENIPFPLLSYEPDSLL